MPEDTPSASHHPMRGVFSIDARGTVGFGSTKRRVQQQVYVFVEEIEGGRVSLTPLNPQFVPSGKKSTLTKEELIKNYLPEPNIYLTKMLPALRDLEKTVDQADDCREKGMHFTAEFEYKNALRIDETHIRATFGLGLTYLDRGEAQRADVVFCRLAKLEATFQPVHKHLFNEFGIKLRKNGMLTQALLHYSRALRVARTDEHLFYNIARVLHARGKIRAARAVLKKALAIKPDFPEALGFKRYMNDLPDTISPLDLTVPTVEECPQPVVEAAP